MLLLLGLTINPFITAMAPGMTPTGPMPTMSAPGAMPGLTNAGGGQLSPEELAAQEEFNEMLAALQEMPEEELQQFEKALETEVKQELEKMSPQERKEFEDKMAEFWIAQGIDPNTIPPLEEMFSSPANAPQEMQPTTDASTSLPADAEGYGGRSSTSGSQEIATPTITPSITAVPVQSQEDVAEMLDALIARIDSLRKKATSDAPEFKRLSSWKEAMDELAYFLKVINKPEHHERLATKDFTRLFKLLQNLRDKLTLYEPQLLIEEVDEHTDDPYEILRVASTASADTIKQAYEQYVAAKNPETLREKLTKDGFSEDDIEGQIKSAKLSLNTITDAYETLSDPKLRAQTDRSLKAARLYRESSETEAKKALDHILQQLSTAVYQQKVLTELEQFLQKYAPTELAAHKKMQEAEAKRKKEQADATKIQPAIGYAHYDQYYPQAQPSYQQDQGRGYDGGGYYPDYHDGYQQDGRGGEAADSKKDSKSGDKGGDKGKEKPKDEKDKKDKDEKSAQQDKKAKEQKAKPTPEDDWNKAVKELSKELDAAQQAVNAQLAVDKKAREEVVSKRGATAQFVPVAQEIADIKKKLSELAELEANELEAKQNEIAKESQETPEERALVRKKQIEAITVTQNEYSAMNDAELNTKIHALHNRLVPLLANVNLDSLNKKFKTFTETTEKAQELGFRLTYASTWKKIAEKNKTALELIQAYRVTTKSILDELEHPVTGTPTEAELKAIPAVKKTAESLSKLADTLDELETLMQPRRAQDSDNEIPSQQMKEYQDQKLAAQEAAADQGKEKKAAAAAGTVV